MDRDAVKAKRDKLVLAKDYEQVSKTVGELENLEQHWEELHARMLKEYHDRDYLLGGIPRELEFWKNQLKRK